MCLCIVNVYECEFVKLCVMTIQVRVFKYVGLMSVEVCGCVSGVCVVYVCSACLSMGMDLVCNSVCMSEEMCLSVNIWCVSVCEYCVSV